MRKKLILLMVCFMLGWVTCVYAGNTQSIPLLMQNYLAALKTKQTQTIKTTLAELSRSTETLTDLQKNFPHYFQLYKLGKMSERLDALRGRYTQSSKSAAGDSAQRIGKKRFSQKEFSQNQEITRKSPNQRRIANHQTAHQLRNQTRDSNNFIALRYSNRTRPSNQDIIRTRKRR